MAEELTIGIGADVLIRTIGDAWIETRRVGELYELERAAFLRLARRINGLRDETIGATTSGGTARPAGAATSGVGATSSTASVSGVRCSTASGLIFVTAARGNEERRGCRRYCACQGTTARESFTREL